MGLYRDGGAGGWCRRKTYPNVGVQEGGHKESTVGRAPQGSVAEWTTYYSGVDRVHHEKVREKDGSKCRGRLLRGELKLITLAFSHIDHFGGS